MASSCSTAWLIPGGSSNVDAGIDYAGVVELWDAEAEALCQSC